MVLKEGAELINGTFLKDWNPKAIEQGLIHSDRVPKPKTFFGCQRQAAQAVIQSTF